MRVALSLAVILAGVGAALGAAQAKRGQTKAIPAAIQKELAALVGTWKMEGRVGTEKFSGTWVAKWAKGRHCLVRNAAFQEGEETGVSVSVIGWNAATSRLEEHAFGSDGSSGILRWKVKSATEWEGELEAVEDGQSFTAPAKVTKKGATEVIYETKNLAGEEVEIILRKDETRRVKRAKKPKD